jgi:hypothetical protein
VGGRRGPASAAALRRRPRPRSPTPNPDFDAVGPSARQASATPAACGQEGEIMIYIGKFFYVTNQQEIEEAERRHGEFDLIIEAGDGQGAFAAFKERIAEIRAAGDFFMGHTSIFFIQLLEFDRFPRTQALMLNLRSTAGDPLMPFIGCSLPSDQGDACRIYDWKNNRPEIDGQNEQLFLEFRE